MARKPPGEGLLARLSCCATSPRQRQEEREVQSPRHRGPWLHGLFPRDRVADRPAQGAGWQMRSNVTLLPGHRTLIVNHCSAPPRYSVEPEPEWACRKPRRDRGLMTSAVTPSSSLWEFLAPRQPLAVGINSGAQFPGLSPGHDGGLGSTLPPELAHRPPLAATRKASCKAWPLSAVSSSVRNYNKNPLWNRKEARRWRRLRKGPEAL